MRYNALSQLKAKTTGAGKYADGQGLWLVKRDKTFGKWVLRLTHHAKRREMGLGRFPDVSIAEARGRADAARKTLRDGIDPIFDREKAKRAQKPLTLKEAIDGCFEARKAELKRDGEAGRWMSPLSVHIIPKIGNYPAIEVDQHVLVEILSPIWHEKPEAAQKALNRLTLTLKHAAALGLDVDLQATMKARALLGKQRHTVEHIPSLPYEDAAKFYQWLRTVDTTSALALRFLMLTLARTTEIRLATVREFSGSIWTLPPERTKTKREHRIPLTPETQLVYERALAKSPNEFLFSTTRGKPISDAAMSKLMKDHGYIARPHGFRATFRTWAEEQTNATHELKEATLGHVVDTGVVGAYQRSGRFRKRQKLMEIWAKFLTNV